MTASIAAAGAAAQQYPARPLRIITAVPSDGGDIISRLIAVPLARALDAERDHLLRDLRDGTLRADLDLALKSVADKYGIVLRTGTCRFTDQSATMKLDIAWDCSL